MIEMFLCILFSFSCAQLLSQETIWQNVSSPYGGIITSIAIDSSGAVLMGTFGGGVWRSTDKGDRWFQQNQGLSHPFVKQLLVAPSGEVIAATSKGIFSSNNLCQAWEKADAPDSSFRVLVGDSGGHIYAVTYHGYLYTRDPPQHKWRQCLSQPKFQWENPFRLTINTNGHIFLSSEPTGMFRSTDHGNTWVSTNRGLDTTTMWALSHNKKGELFTSIWEKGIYRSVDDGETWQKIDSSHKVVAEITFAQDGTRYLSTIMPSQLLRFQRGTELPDTVLRNKSAHRFEFYQTGEIYALGNSRVFRSTDSGKKWQTIAQEFSDLRYSADLPIDDQDRLYALDDDYGLFRTTNNGLKWEQLGAGINMMTSFAIGHHNQMFAGTFKEGFFSSTDGGQNWKKVAQHTIDTMTTHLAIAMDGTIFAGLRQNTSYRPRKDGRGSEEIRSGGGIYSSTDGGVTWELSGFPGLNIHNIRSVGDDLYAIVWSTSRQLYKLRTRKEWLPVGPPGGINTFSTAGRDTIYAGSDNGVFASFDAGLHFQQMNNGLAYGGIKDIAVMPGKGVFTITETNMYFLPNGSQTWRVVESPKATISKLQVLENHIFCDPHFGFRLIEEGSQNGIYRADVDKLLQTLPAMPREDDFWTETSPSGLNEVDKMEVDAKGTMFIASEDDMSRSSNEGSSWDRLSISKSHFRRIESFCLHQKTKSLYLLKTDSITMSSDGGDSWIGISAPLKSQDEPFIFLRDITVSENNTIALAVDIDFDKSCVFLSSNAGAGWVKVPAATDGIQHFLFHPNGDLLVGCIGKVYRVNPNDLSVESIGLTLFDPSAFYMDNVCWDADHAIRCLTSDPAGKIYATRIEYSDGAIFQSDDEGSSWHRLTNVGNSIRGVVRSPDDELFVATNIGVFRSQDGGTTWLPLSLGLKDGNITTLVLHPNGHLFAGTASGKIFKSVQSIATQK